MGGGLGIGGLCTLFAVKYTTPTKSLSLSMESAESAVPAHLRENVGLLCLLSPTVALRE